MTRRWLVVLIGATLAAPGWAASSPVVLVSSPPLVEPRAGAPDPVVAQEPAREDSLSAAGPPHHRSGGQALAIGLACTFAPAALAVLVNPPGSQGDFAWEASLALGVVVGVVTGPAIGLASGGRGDLAKRGLIVRVIGGVPAFAAAVVVAGSLDSQPGAGAQVLVLAGLAGAGLIAVSSVHDLVITRSAVEKGRPVSVAPWVDPAGRVGLRVTF